MNQPFYKEWFPWVRETVSSVEARLPERLPELATDVCLVTAQLIDLVDSIPTRGKTLSLLGKIGQWVAAHPDPLVETRAEMRAIKTKWDVILAEAASVRAGKPTG